MYHELILFLSRFPSAQKTNQNRAFRKQRQPIWGGFWWHFFASDNDHVKELSIPHVWSPNRSRPPRHCNSPRPETCRGSKIMEAGAPGPIYYLRIGSSENLWFRARWFWIRIESRPSNNPFHNGTPRIQTTGPQSTNLPSADGRWKEKKQLSCAKNTQKMTFQMFLHGWSSDRGAIFIFA